jgi:hypothetical protein
MTTHLQSLQGQQCDFANMFAFFFQWAYGKVYFQRLNRCVLLPFFLSKLTRHILMVHNPTKTPKSELVTS